MKRLVDGFITSLGMFSITPAPKVWNEKAFPWVMPAFPLVGFIIGCLWYGFTFLLMWLNIPLMLRAAFVFLFPLFYSGFIHVDGYMDTCDAIFSRAEPGKKREILKDPHTGAFAVIFLGIYLLLGLASTYCALERGLELLVFVFIPILSRCLAGVALLTIKPLSAEGLGAVFRKNTKPVHSVILLCLTLSCFIAGCMWGGETILFPLSGLLIGAVLSALYSVRQLGGISGDLCGFIITASELCALLVTAVC